MAKFRIIKSSFVSGELDPAARGRVDTSIYQKAADKIRNAYVRPQGGVFRREGLEYVGPIANNFECRLIPFEFNDEQTYILVFTAGSFQVYRTDQNSVQATVSSSPISGLTTDIIKEMRFTQSADTLILVHKDMQPIEISRTSHTSWTAANVTFDNIPPYAFGTVSTSTPAGSVTPDVKTGRVTLAGSGTAFTTDVAVGQFINTPKGGRIYIRSIASNTELEGDVIVELADTTAISSGDWEYESGYEDVMSATRGWPRAVTFYKSRLVLGGLGSRPSTLLFSKVADFFDLDVGSGLDDEGIDVTIGNTTGSGKVNVINDLYPGRALQIFTTGGEYTIRSSINDPLTPNTIASQLSNDTSHGSGNIDSTTVVRAPSPTSVDGATVFVEAGGAVVRQFVYNDAEDSFNATNISILSSHLVNTPRAMAIRKANSTHPADFLYMVNDDGTCAVLNSLREQDLLAWSLFDTAGEFEDVAVAGNKTYFAVKRTINGGEVRHLEVLNPENYFDASIKQTAASTTSWTGLSHLNGETVSVRGDDYILQDAAVSGGAITSSQAVETLEAGLDFFMRIVDLPLELQVQGQSFAGEYKAPVSANVLLKDSRNYLVKYNNKTFAPAFREFGGGVLDAPISNYSGWKKTWLGGVKRDVSIEITQDEGLELNVLAVHYEVRV